MLIFCHFCSVGRETWHGECKVIHSKDTGKPLIPTCWLLWGLLWLRKSTVMLLWNWGRSLRNWSNSTTLQSADKRCGSNIRECSLLWACAQHTHSRWRLCQCCDLPTDTNGDWRVKRAYLVFSMRANLFICDRSVGHCTYRNVLRDSTYAQNRCEILNCLHSLAINSLLWLLAGVWVTATTGKSPPGPHWRPQETAPPLSIRPGYINSEHSRETQALRNYASIIGNLVCTLEGKTLMRIIVPFPRAGHI